MTLAELRAAYRAKLAQMRSIAAVGVTDAIGGGVNSGTTYLVGEAGPELFTPKTGGSIIPNHKLGGNAIHYNIQVANGVTPEETDMRVRAALREYHPHAVSASVAAMHDALQRSPRR